MFTIAAAIYLVGCLIYWFWASGEIQPWAKRAAEEAAANQNGHHESGNVINKKTGYVNEAVELKE